VDHGIRILFLYNWTQFEQIVVERAAEVLVFLFQFLAARTETELADIVHGADIKNQASLSLFFEYADVFKNVFRKLFAEIRITEAKLINNPYTLLVHSKIFGVGLEIVLLCHPVENFRSELFFPA